MLQARYEKDQVYYETPTRSITSVQPAAVNRAGLLSISGTAPFTLSTDLQGVTAVLSNGAEVFTDGSVVTVSYPNGERCSKPLSAIGGPNPLVSGSCARDLAGMGLSTIGLIAGCALTGGLLAVVIVAVAGFTGLGLSEWAAIQDCY